MISVRCRFLLSSQCISKVFKSRVVNKRDRSGCLVTSALHSFSREYLKRSTQVALVSIRMASTSTDDEKPEQELSSVQQNRLALEKSPYLLQHANNPVQWYPWGEEAFDKARKENKLIFLSIGYSTCHWCHVMEKESFEDPEIAKVMNQYYINVKVDREERPDVDRIYMTFIQTISGHGGWPMSVFLTPELSPVTGGTYFPPNDTLTQPGFKSILLGIAHKWEESKEDLMKSGAHIVSALKQSLRMIDDDPDHNIPPPGSSVLCVRQLSRSYQEKFGGFSYAPKFPQPVNLNFLFHMYAREPSSEIGKECLNMCLQTLRKMANGGIHDHIGQGFSRYSVDSMWHVPHFEKMLYDQAQLMQSYLEAYLASNDTFYSEIVDDIATYVLRDLKHKEGGFYSAEDADSLPSHDSKSKVEGAFYVWRFDELEDLLTQPVLDDEDLYLLDIFCYHYNIKEEGNVATSQDPYGELIGQNVLIVNGSLEKTAENFECSVDEIRQHLEESRKILFEARLNRPRPHLDDKIVTAWNGLMISGLARAGAVLQNNDYISAAIEAAKFVEKYLFDNAENVLFRSCYRGPDDQIIHLSVPIKGFHVDYAFFVKALLDLYESCFDTHWLELAETLQDIQDKLFWDSENGGYYSTTADDSTIIVRLKDEDDGAEPSSNSIACDNLLRLAGFLDRVDFKDKAVRILKALCKTIERVPVAVPQLTSALMKYHDSMAQIFIVGKLKSSDTESMLKVVRDRLIPGRILIVSDPDETDNILHCKNHIVKNLKMINNQATAYVCLHHTCSLPLTKSDELATLLEDNYK